MLSYGKLQKHENALLLLSRENCPCSPCSLSPCTLHLAIFCFSSSSFDSFAFVVLFLVLFSCSFYSGCLGFFFYSCCSCTFSCLLLSKMLGYVKLPNEVKMSLFMLFFVALSLLILLSLFSVFFQGINLSVLYFLSIILCLASVGFISFCSCTCFILLLLCVPLCTLYAFDI